MFRTDITKLLEKLFARVLASQRGGLGLIPDQGMSVAIVKLSRATNINYRVTKRNYLNNSTRRRQDCPPTEKKKSVKTAFARLNLFKKLGTRPRHTCINKPKGWKILVRANVRPRSHLPSSNWVYFADNGFHEIRLDDRYSSLSKWAVLAKKMTPAAPIFLSVGCVAARRPLADRVDIFTILKLPAPNMRTRHEQNILFI